MKKYFNSKVILLLIVILAAFVRLYNVSSIPPTLNWDEAALGYNAYALSLEARDEFGKFLPIQYLESYGDYKPVLYSYLAAIPVKLLGLGEFAVRFPSALLGTLSVLLTFFLVKEIFPKKDNARKTESIALLSALILALSPWHIMLSRAAYEANVSTFFIILGIFFFLKAINKNMWYLLGSSVSLALSFYTFNTARVFVPLMVFALGVFFWKKLWQNKKETLLALVVGIVLLAPLIPFLNSPQAKLRFAEVNIFSDANIVINANKYVENDNNAVWSKIIHNRRVLYGVEFTRHYLDNLNPRFLFITGDGNPRFSTQDVGQLYLLELPFLLIGAFLLFRKKEGHYLLIPVWFLLGIIPAATARETPHALRIETVLPTVQIVIAYGVISTAFVLKRFKNIFIFAFLALLFLNFSYFYRGLLTHYSREYSSEWQYPYRELVSYVNENNDKYDKFVITNRLGRPYIYFLLYNKTTPSEFRKNAKIDREALGFVHVRQLGRYDFVEDVPELLEEDRTLYIDVPSEKVEGRMVKTFNYLDGIPALIAYEKNK